MRKTLISELDDKNNNCQYNNALWIGFNGGYSMFIDLMDEDSTQEKIINSDIEALLCS